MDPGSSPLPGGAAEVVRFFMHAPQWVQIGGAVLVAVATAAVLLLVWRRRARILDGVKGLSPAVKAGVMAIVAVGAVGLAVTGYAGYDYIAHDNGFCTGCHVMVDSYVRFQQSAHAELGCHDCHQQPMSASLRQLYHWVRDRPEEIGPHAPVPDARCASCHIDEDPDRWPQIAASLGHGVHLESEDPELSDVLCVSCHGVSVHDFVPAATTCGQCHEEGLEIRLGRMTGSTDVHCVACHDFLGTAPVQLAGAPAGLALVPSRPKCLGCHEMEAIVVAEQLTDDPHGAVCGVCHNPHTQTAPREAVETCQECHERSDTLTSFHRGRHADVHPRCASCHRAHSWKLDGLDCLSCHETILEDQVPGVTRSRLLRDVSRPSVLGGGVRGLPASLAFAVHAVGSAAALPSAGARQGEVTAPDTLPPRRRPFLHSQHRTVSCLECHRTGGDEHGEVTVRTAGDCAACHHDPRRGYRCEACHREGDLISGNVPARMDLTVWEEARVRELPFSHATHGGLECRDCHGPTVDVTVSVGCAECHAEHHRPEMECARCHVARGADVHPVETHLTCAGCHTGEAAERPELSRTLCLMCHIEQEDHEPGGTCHECHMIPDPPPVRVGFGPPGGAAPASPGWVGRRGMW